MSLATFRARFLDFVEAAARLDEAWTTLTADETHAVSAGCPPYLPAFTDFCADLRAWRVWQRTTAAAAKVRRFSTVDDDGHDGEPPWTIPQFCINNAEDPNLEADVAALIELDVGKSVVLGGGAHGDTVVRRIS